MTDGTDNNNSASPTIAGFDYQYYYFLWRLLQLKHGESIGYEVLDDVHMELNDGSKELIQLKHTINKNSNLTELDSDLWKTLHNYASSILNIDSKEERIAEIRRTKYVIVTNKGGSARNKFLDKITSFQKKQGSIEEILQHIDSLKTADEALVNYISTFKSAPKYVLTEFFKKLDVSTSEDGLIEQITKQIEVLFIPTSNIDDVFSCLDSNIKRDFYLNTKSKSQNTISFKEFSTKYKNCFKFGRTDKLPVRAFEDAIPNDFMEQTFVKQLIEIGDVYSTEEDEIREFTRLKLLMVNNLKEWGVKGELTPTQEEKFFKNCTTIWKAKFREHHQDNRSEIAKGNTLDELEEKIVQAGRNCLSDLRSLVLDIEGDILDYEISHGQFYLMSDKPQIGWRLDWEKKYKDGNTNS